MGDCSERDEHCRRGGCSGGGGGIGREPKEAVGGEDEEAGFEAREVRVFIGFEVNGGENGGLDLAGTKDWSAALRQLRRR